MAKQYLYVLSNPKHEGLLKIGGTDKHPTIRADQLTRQTGAIGTFQVEWYMVVPNWRVAEQMAFFLLKEQLDQKEYFKLDLLTAVSRIQVKLEQFFELENSEIFEEKMLKALRLKEKSKDALLRLKLKLEAETNSK